MTVRATIQVHFDAGDVSHRHTPSYSTLELDSGAVAAHLFFMGPDMVDAVVAELTALRAEMTGDAAVEFTSDSRLAPARCLQPGEHGPALAGAVVDCDRPEHHAEPAAAVLAASIADGTPLMVTDDDETVCGFQWTGPRNNLQHKCSRSPHGDDDTGHQTWTADTDGQPVRLTPASVTE